MRETGISVYQTVLLPNTLPAVPSTYWPLYRCKWEEALLEAKVPRKVINSFLSMMVSD